MLLKTPGTRVHEQVPELAYLGPCIWTAPSDRSSIRGLGFLGGVAYWNLDPARQSILPGNHVTARAAGTLAMLGASGYDITHKLWDRAIVPTGNIHTVVPAYLQALEQRLGSNRGSWLQQLVDAREMGVVYAADIRQYWGSTTLAAAREIATNTTTSVDLASCSLRIRRALATLPGAWQSPTLLGSAFALRENTVEAINEAIHEPSPEQMLEGAEKFRQALRAILAQSA